MRTDAFAARSFLETGSGEAVVYRLSALRDSGIAPGLDRLPFSIRVLLESVLRNVDGEIVTEDDVKRLASWNAAAVADVELPFVPARVILQDFTGVPAVVDLASMRAAVKRLGHDPARINPLVPVDLVVDHSVQVDVFGSKDAAEKNAAIEFSRNGERYEFLRWGQKAFQNFRVVPPATGIVHQVNLEYLAQRRPPAGAGRRDGRDARHPRRHRLAHDDDQRPRRPRLGCRRHRGRGGDARPAALHGHPAGRRLPPRREAAARAPPPPTSSSP